MHIAIVPHSAPSNGGAYQYSLAVLDALTTMLTEQGGYHYTLLARSKQEYERFHQEGANWTQARLPLFTRERVVDMVETFLGEGWFRDVAKRVSHRLVPASLKDPDRIWTDGAARRFLKGIGIEWALYTTPNTQSFETGLPYVMPVFDLQHRLQPQFPEVSANGEWERREYLYRNGTRQATMILADSEVGKEDILMCYGSYGVTPDRVKVLPYVPPPYLWNEVSPEERTRARIAYELPERYLFYPAQLWPHKNHVRLVQAIGLLKDTRKFEVHLVLSGSASGGIRTQVRRDMMREAQRLGVAAQIHYLGYVPNNDMSALYAGAVGLVMPTFFGPTNIPIREAWLLGCPILTSDIRGIREQVGDAGLLVDPSSVEALADGIRRIWEDERLRADLSGRGKQRLAAYGLKEFRASLAAIIAETNRCVRDEQAFSHSRQMKIREVPG